jgi:uncharacterized protein
MTMLLLLPPSETKRDGGELPGPVSHRPLRFPGLVAPRDSVRSALRALLEEGDAAVSAALKLGARVAATEVARNRTLDAAPLMPAIDRYTGVLFDALDGPGLSREAGDRAGRHVIIQSALWGQIGAHDPIPAYRLSYDSRLPGIRLATLWAPHVTAEWEQHHGPIVDLRSAGYASLGPLPRGRPEAASVSVVTRTGDGSTRALNHFNKRGKGLFVRDLLEAGDLPATIDELCTSAQRLGWQLAPVAADQLELIVPEGR